MRPSITSTDYVAFFCIVLCATLFPIAKAPNDLILKPMRRLVSLVSTDQEDERPSGSHDFSEMRDLEIELRSLLAERRLRVEEQIEMEQSKAITQAAQMLAHDFRRPFALVKAALDGMAQARSAESAKKLADKTLPRVNNAFLALDAMLDELMMLGRPQSIPAVRVDMKLIVEQAMETSLALYPGSDRRASVDLEENLFVQGHAGHLQRVLSNLVVNALQIMSPSDALEVSGRRNGDRIEIRVHNTGSHIPAEEHTSIFKLFYTKGKTSGLGLAGHTPRRASLGSCPDQSRSEIYPGINLRNERDGKTLHKAQINPQMGGRTRRLPPKRPTNGSDST